MSGTQLTLTGEQMDVRRVGCGKYRACDADAEYAVDVLDTKVGQEVTVRCCTSCKREFAEWVDSENIRELSRSERLVPREDQ